MHVLRVFDTVSLQSTEIVPIPQFSEEVLENCPVPIATGGTVPALEVGLDVSLDVVVVEKCVIDIDQEHDLVHRSYPHATPCSMLGARLGRAARISKLSPSDPHIQISVHQR